MLYFALSAPDTVMISQTLADRSHLQVGDDLTLRVDGSGSV